jgi:methyl-accepting chemotaxis protein
MSYIPGFGGYIERSNRRSADKLLRDTVARRFEELVKRLSALQTDLISQGGIEYMDEMEKAALQMRTFADKIRNATYGYSGFFDAVKINEEELAKLYAFDSAFFQIADQLSQALDTVENALGNTDALPAAIRNLVTLAREATQTYDRRYEVITGTGQ